MPPRVANPKKVYPVEAGHAVAMTQPGDFVTAPNVVVYTAMYPAAPTWSVGTLARNGTLEGNAERRFPAPKFKSDGSLVTSPTWVHVVSLTAELGGYSASTIMMVRTATSLHRVLDGVVTHTWGLENLYDTVHACGSRVALMRRSAKGLAVWKLLLIDAIGVLATDTHVGYCDVDECVITAYAGSDIRLRAWVVSGGVLVSPEPKGQGEIGRAGVNGMTFYEFDKSGCFERGGVADHNAPRKTLCNEWISDVVVSPSGRHAIVHNFDHDTLSVWRFPEFVCVSAMPVDEFARPAYFCAEYAAVFVVAGMFVPAKFWRLVDRGRGVDPKLGDDDDMDEL